MKRCKDCGTPIDATGRKWAKTRCDGCQEAFRLEYWKEKNKIKSRRDLYKLGSRDPFKIDDFGCGKNKDGEHPRKKQPWMTYYTDSRGNHHDEITDERKEAIEEWNILQNNTNYTNDDIEPIKTKNKKEKYKGWKYW